MRPAPKQILREQTKTHISALSDAQLTEYIQEGIAGQYTAEAVDFARQIYAARQLPEEGLAEVDRLGEEKLSERTKAAAAAARQPLGMRGRILSLAMGATCWGLLPVLILMVICDRAKNRGEFRKVQEIRRFVVLGFMLVVVVGIILALMQKWMAK
jgi:hypothetical protein